MFKRLLAVLLALLLPVAALSEGMIASCVVPDGAEMLFLTETDAFIVPDGLEDMYRLMQSATLNGDVYLLRLRNGRALASISCTQVSAPRTAEQLWELWPQIAQNLALEASAVNDDPSCAAIDTRYGREALCIRTQLDVGTHNVVPLEASAFAFCRGSEMIEVWTVHPNPNVYLYNETAAAELESDLADLEAFLDTLDFSVQVGLSVSGSEYADPQGRFSLQTPKTAVAITPDTPEETVLELRERFIAANDPGAEVFFDDFMRERSEMDITLILTDDMKGAIEIFCTREPDFKGATTEMLCGLAGPIRENLEELYGTALLLNVENGSWILSGHKQAVLSYWVRAGEMDMQLDVLSCVIGEDWLCEVDVFTADGDQTLRNVLHLLLAQTLTYTVE